MPRSVTQLPHAYASVSPLWLWLHLQADYDWTPASDSTFDLTKMAEQIPIRNSTATKDILIDFVIVYLFVPFWITLFATNLKYYHETYDWYSSWRRDYDLLMFPAIFLLIAVPLTYLRFQASNPSHFLHHLRVETTESFIERTKENMPTLFRADILINIGVITAFNLSNIFQDTLLSEVSSIEMYVQSLAFLALFDSGTYWGHRLVHHPKWYHYHKKHHEVRNTVAISLIHIDMADFFVNNAPVILLPVLFRLVGIAMVYEVWIIGFAFVFAQGFIIHCDLRLCSARWSLGLFWGNTVVSHSLHHSKNIGHYSFVSPQIWDWICDSLWLETGYGALLGAKWRCKGCSGFFFLIDKIKYVK